MKLLLDTRILLWAAQGVKHLPLDAQNLMNDPENELLFSIASLWGIVIKFGWLYPEKAHRLPGGDLWDL
jgi:PIN domain nuclease of toxin-antitoxin system